MLTLKPLILLFRAMTANFNPFPVSVAIYDGISGGSPFFNRLEQMTHDFSP